jgi:colicin import membrane protein
MGKGKSEDGGPGAKAKAQSAAARKESDAAAAAAKEKRVETQWEDGGNARAAAKAKEAADKEAARLAAKAAKEAAEASDSAELSNMRLPAGKARKAANAKGSKEDLSMLDAYLDSTKKKGGDKAKLVAPANVAKQVDPLLLPNLNRVLAAQAAEGHVDATGLDNALAALGAEEAKPGEKGPSRKAAYAAFEDEAMARLKAEYPTLKRSQLLEKIWKEWERSPMNPDNKPP